MGLVALLLIAGCGKEPPKGADASLTYFEIKERNPLLNPNFPIVVVLHEEGARRPEDPVKEFAMRDPMIQWEAVSVGLGPSADGKPTIVALRKEASRAVVTPYPDAPVVDRVPWGQLPAYVLLATDRPARVTSDLPTLQQWVEPYLKRRSLRELWPRSIQITLRETLEALGSPSTTLLERRRFLEMCAGAGRADWVEELMEMGVRPNLQEWERTLQEAVRAHAWEVVRSWATPVLQDPEGIGARWGSPGWKPVLTRETIGLLAERTGPQNIYGLAGPDELNALSRWGVRTQPVYQDPPRRGSNVYAFPAGGYPASATLRPAIVPPGTDEVAPIHVAAATNNPIAVKGLLRAGADPNQRSKNGLRAIDYARKFGHWRVTQVLKELGADG